MTTDDGEMNELADLNTEVMHAVGKAANGTAWFIAKGADDGDGAGLFSPGFVSELVAKASPGAPESSSADAGSITVTGSPDAIARMIHQSATTHRVAKSTDSEYVAFVKAKYTAEQKRKLADQGHAMRNSDGEPDYPVDDLEDLKNAIRAVGRGGADHNKIRKYVMGRARSMGHADLIPDTWAADGSLKEPVSKALIDGSGTGGMDPGSPAWEAQDAASAEQVIERILAVIPSVKALAQREGAEVGAGHMDDLADICDLQAVQDALMCAAKTLGGFAVSEHAEAGTPVTKALDAPQSAADAAPKGEITMSDTTQTGAAAEPVAKADGALTEAELAEFGRAAIAKAAAKAEKKKVKKAAAQAAASATQAPGANPAPADDARTIPGTNTVQAPAQQPGQDVAKAQADQLAAALGQVMAPVVKQLGELATQVNAQQERVEKAMARPDDRNSPALNGANGTLRVADRDHAGSPVHTSEFQAVQKQLSELPEGEVRDAARAAVAVAAIKARFGG